MLQLHEGKPELINSYLASSASDVSTLLHSQITHSNFSECQVPMSMNVTNMQQPTVTTFLDTTTYIKMQAE